MSDVEKFDPATSELTPELWEHVRSLRCSDGWTPDDYLEQSDWSALAVELFQDFAGYISVCRDSRGTRVIQGMSNYLTYVPGTDAAAFCLCVIRAWVRHHQQQEQAKP